MPINEADILWEDDIQWEDEVSPGTEGASVLSDSDIQWDDEVSPETPMETVSSHAEYRPDYGQTTPSHEPTTFPTTDAARSIPEGADEFGGAEESLAPQGEDRDYLRKGLSLGYKGAAAGINWAARELIKGLDENYDLYAEQEKRKGKEPIPQFGETIISNLKDGMNYWREASKKDIIEEFQVNPFEDPKVMLKPGYWVYGISQQVPMLMSAFAGGPLLGGIVGGAQQAQDTYYTNIENGATERQASKSATADFFMNTALETLGFEGMFAKGGNFMFRGTVGAVSETGTEFTQNLSTSINQQITKGVASGKSGEEILTTVMNDLSKTAFDATSGVPLSVVMGGGVGAVTGGGETSAKQREREVQQRDEDIRREATGYQAALAPIVPRAPKEPEGFGASPAAQEARVREQRKIFPGTAAATTEAPRTAQEAEYQRYQPNVPMTEKFQRATFPATATAILEDMTLTGKASPAAEQAAIDGLNRMTNELRRELAGTAVAETKPMSPERFKEELATSQYEPEAPFVEASRLSRAVGEPDFIEHFTSLRGVKHSEGKATRTVIDHSVVQQIDIAEALEKKGKTELANKYFSKAIDNITKMRSLTDNPKTLQILQEQSDRVFGISESAKTARVKEQRRMFPGTAEVAPRVPKTPEEAAYEVYQPEPPKSTKVAEVPVTPSEKKGRKAPVVKKESLPNTQARTSEKVQQRGDLTPSRTYTSEALDISKEDIRRAEEILKKGVGEQIQSGMEGDTRVTEVTPEDLIEARDLLDKAGVRVPEARTDIAKEETDARIEKLSEGADKISKAFIKGDNEAITATVIKKFNELNTQATLDKGVSKKTKYTILNEMVEDAVKKNPALEETIRYTAEEIRSDLGGTIDTRLRKGIRWKTEKGIKGLRTGEDALGNKYIISSEGKLKHTLFKNKKEVGTFEGAKGLLKAMNSIQGETPESAGYSVRKSSDKGYTVFLGKNALHSTKLRSKWRADLFVKEHYKNPKLGVATLAAKLNSMSEKPADLKTTGMKVDLTKAVELSPSKPEVSPETALTTAETVTEGAVTPKAEDSTDKPRIIRRRKKRIDETENFDIEDLDNDSYQKGLDLAEEYIDIADADYDIAIALLQVNYETGLEKIDRATYEVAMMALNNVKKAVALESGDTDAWENHFNQTYAGVFNAADLIDRVISLNINNSEYGEDSPYIVMLNLLRDNVPREKLSAIDVAFDPTWDGAFFEHNPSKKESAIIIGKGYDDPSSIIHEVTHSITVREMATNPELKAKVTLVRETVMKHVIDKGILTQEMVDKINSVNEDGRAFIEYFRNEVKAGPNTLGWTGEQLQIAYGLVNNRELLSKTLEFKSFTQLLKEIPAPKQSKLKSILQWVRTHIFGSALGIKEKDLSLFEHCLELTLEISQAGYSLKNPIGNMGAPLHVAPLMNRLSEGIVDLNEKFSNLKEQEREGKDVSEKLKKTEELIDRSQSAVAKLFKLPVKKETQDAIDAINKIRGIELDTKDFQQRRLKTRATLAKISLKKEPKFTVLKARAEEAREGFEDLFGVISEVLRNIDPALEIKLNKFEFDIDRNINRHLKLAKEFFEEVKKMSKVDRLELDHALISGNTQVRDLLFDKYPNVKNGYANVQTILSELEFRAKASGMVFDSVQDYFPRHVKDLDGLMKHFKEVPERGKYGYLALEVEAAKAKAKREGKPWVDGVDDKIVVEKVVMSGRYGHLPKPTAAKERTVDHVTPGMSQYYYSSTESLYKHIVEMNEKIGVREFIGVTSYSKDNKRIQTIGSRISKLMSLETLTEKQQKEVDRLYKEFDFLTDKLTNSEEIIKNGISSWVVENLKVGKHQDRVIDLLRARFLQQGAYGVTATARNVMYAVTLGSPASAIVQLGDLAVTTLANPTTAVQGVFKAAASQMRDFGRKDKKSVVSKEFDFVRAQREFTIEGKSARLVDKVLTIAGFKHIDLFGKESLMLASAKRWANASEKSWKKKWGHEAFQEIFTGDRETIQKQLRNGEWNDDTLFMVYYDLAQWQPINLSQMPRAYLRAGRARIFYMLKTFGIKALNNSFRQIASDWKLAGESDSLVKKNYYKSRGITKAAGVLMVYALAGAGADELKDIMDGKSESIKDNTWDNLIQLSLVCSRYTLESEWKRGKLVESILGSFLPPVRFASDIVMDIAKLTQGEVDFKSYRNMPLVGRFFYNQLGKGKESYLNMRRTKLLKEYREAIESGESTVDIRQDIYSYNREVEKDKRISSDTLKRSKRTAKVNKKKNSKKSSGINIGRKLMEIKEALTPKKETSALTAKAIKRATDRLGVPIAQATINLKEFSKRIGEIENMGKLKGKNPTSSAKGLYQFIDSASVTAANRLIASVGEKDWILDLKNKKITVEELDKEQQTLLFLANLLEMSGSDEIMKKVMKGNRDAWIEAYYKLHHTRPEDLTESNKRRVTRIIKGA